MKQHPREAEIHFELYHALTSVIGKSAKLKQFDKVEAEYPIKGIGRADLVITDKYGKKILVIETKSPIQTNDPYEPKVIDQALRYANWLGAHYFATCDGRTFVLFDNKETGIEFWQRKRIPPFDLTKVKNLEEFADRLLNDIIALEQGTKKWSGIDEAFVARLKILHERLVHPIFESLTTMLHKSNAFEDRYADWLSKQGLEINDFVNRKIAVETAYMLLNKILFYKVLETKYPSLPKLTKINILLEVDAEKKFKEILYHCFKEALKIDYRAVFAQSVYDEIKLPTEVIQRLNEFLHEASRYDISKIESDIIGQIYEGLIPQEERKRLGQYYTPPAICDLIVRLCVQDSNALVLDPACGSGGFLVKAYYQLLQLRKSNLSGESIHQEILNQLWGIDISAFPAHLAVINLAMRNLKAKSNVINIIPHDFFRSLPKQVTLKPIETAPIDEARATYEFLPQFDVVTCNPPYTRQDDIGDEHYRKHIRKVALSLDGKIDISSEAGIYAYFFTHTTHFLKENGMFGYIVSNSWCDAKFGREIQHFFLDNFKLITIMEFDKRAFTDAAINTVIVIAKKLSGHINKKERDSNTVKFIRIKSVLKPEQIEYLVNSAVENYEDDKARITLKVQGDLYTDNKWMLYLRAPRIFFDTVKNEKITKLGTIASINVGIITFANDFFVLNKDKCSHWHIEKEYLMPIISNTKDVTKLDINSHDIKECLFFVNKAKDGLKNTNALRYIEYGENKPIEITRGATKGKTVHGYQNIPSFKGKRLWYAIRERKPAPIIVPDLMWERNFATWNRSGCLTTHAFYEITPNDHDDTKVLLGMLNSSLLAFFEEIWGRTALGEGAIRMMESEWSTLPIIDPKMLTKRERKRIEKAFLRLTQAVREGDAQQEKITREELDTAIFDGLELKKKDRLRIYSLLQELKEMRKSRAQPEILIDHPETRKKTKKTKKIKNDSTADRKLSEWL